MAKTPVKAWKTAAGINAWIFLIKNSHHCGYVSVPDEISDLDLEEVLIDVHGGITFDGFADWSGGVRVVGYDCAHAGDSCYGYDDGIWRDVDFCVGECEKLAAQLVGLSELKITPKHQN
ncbi:hypothetical protein [Enterobacter oligotrophicus]|uniref:hypothetical protein n=1 Tax=Enterobacter oligotrophicus TaxID=2478464 RepID=UPI0028B0F1D1|nr:hypothetical protein [Enterobacter oligotrophicus]